VYCTSRDDAKIAAVQRAFDSWSKRSFGPKYLMTTPCKDPKKRARDDGGATTGPGKAAAHGGGGGGRGGPGTC